MADAHLPAARAVDPDRLKATSLLVFSKLEGAVTAGMIHLGDVLGLYGAMADGVPVTSEELAGRTGLHERWVREWLHNQGAARIIDVEAGIDGAPDRFSLGPEAAAILAVEDHPAFGIGLFHRLPAMMSLLNELPESFRSGLGHDYDALGCEGAVGIERAFAPWFRTHLVDTCLAHLDGMGERLAVGARVADVGCGAGEAVLLLAEAFPASEVHGFDISRHALARAEAKRVERGITNAVFHDARTEPLPEDASFDLVTAFDCIHDMTHPAEVVAAIRRSLRDDGVWLLADIKGRGSFAENVAKNPMASLMYGISVLSCMSSALSAPGGAGLGTLGLPEPVARAMALDAGFTRFRRLDIEHSVNAFYEARP